MSSSKLSPLLSPLSPSRTSGFRKIFGRNTENLISPVPHLLTCNTIPTEEERMAVIQVLSETESRLNEVLRDLQVDGGSTSSLKKRRDELEKFIAAHRLVLSPLRFMPTEIMQVVFYWSGPSSGQDFGWKDLPWNITHVCRDWREAALGLPHLWNNIPTIDLKKIALAEKPAFVDFLPNLLSRSKQMPLTFTFSVLKGYSKHPIIDALVSQSHRWDTVTLQTTSLTVNETFSGVESRLPQLRRLTLELDSSVTFGRIDTFIDAPQLREVTVVNYPLNKISLPWNQLTTFKESTNFSMTVLLESQVNLPLKHLEITRYNIGAPIFLQVTLPKLVVLRLRFGVNVDPAEFFNNITLPALEELIVWRCPGNIIPPLMGMIQRSGSKSRLKTLSIRSRELVEGEVIALLKLTPFLSKLEINLPWLIDLRGLVAEEDTFVVIPNLKHLVIQDVLAISDLKEAFWDIARTRCEGGLLLSDYDEEQVFRRGQFRQLETFQISFGRIYLSIPHCYEAQMSLNEWESYLYQNKFSLELRNWAKDLCKEIPSMPSPYLFEEKKNLVELWHGHLVHGLFNNIESYPLRDIHDLYPSRLHLFMKWISTAPPDKIPGEARHNIRARAAALYQRWQPLLKADASNVRWVTIYHDFPFVLQYIAPHRVPPEESLIDEKFKQHGELVEIALDDIIDITPQAMWTLESDDLDKW